MQALQIATSLKEKDSKNGEGRFFVESVAVFCFGMCWLFCFVESINHSLAFKNWFNSYSRIQLVPCCLLFNMHPVFAFRSQGNFCLLRRATRIKELEER